MIGLMFYRPPDDELDGGARRRRYFLTREFWRDGFDFAAIVVVLWLLTRIPQ